MIEKIRKNVQSALQMLHDVSDYGSNEQNVSIEEKKFIEEAVKSLQNSIKLINNSLPSLLEQESLTKPLVAKKEGDLMAEITYERPEGKYEVVLSNADKNRFLKELSINESLIRKIKSLGKDEDKDTFEEFQAARGYLKFANKFFLKMASRFVRKGKFSDLGREIRKANLNILVETYVATIIFSSVFSFIIGFFIFIFLLFFEINLVWPMIHVFSGNFLERLIWIIWIPIIAPLAVFVMLYMYPSAERKSLAKHIDQEMPFAVIHMSSISGSGIEPSKIFQIIGMGKEYPYLRREIKKIINQINIYGYDLVTSLTNVAKSTPSEKLSELLSGLATTIQSGGELSDFFHQRAESLLTTYRLDREKYTKVAETFMDIYISVVIATPMILILLLIMIGVSGIQLGFSPVQMSLMIILLVAVVNVVFLGVLHVKQPNY